MVGKLYDSSIDPEIVAKMKNDGIEYAVFPGRRAPMHLVHQECAQEIFDAGLKLIVLNGSANTPANKLYNPLSTPLTPMQQSEQFRRVFPGRSDIVFMPMDDVADDKQWSTILAATLNDPVKLFGFGLTVTDGIADKAISYFRGKAQDAHQDKSKITSMDGMSKMLIESGISPWKSFNTNPAHDDISATPFRGMEVNELRANEDGILAAPQYIADLIDDARKNNPDANLLAKNSIAKTMLDLTFERLRKEAGISTREIIEMQREHGDINFQNLSGFLQETFENRKKNSAITNVIADKLDKAICRTGLNFSVTRS